MKILVVGSGGREHALVAKIASSDLVNKVYCAPGNGGTGEIGENVDIKANDIKGLMAFVINKGIIFTVVGPEDPLVAGIVDEFEAADLLIIGPNKAAAILEGSKIFTRQLLDKYNIPSAEFVIFEDTKKAYAHIKNAGIFPVVIKADGLAAGKGVMVCSDLSEAEKALERIRNQEFKEAGHKFLVEEYLPGEEASYIVLVDRKGHIVPLASSQDHKRVDDNDQGLNTGGMGAYSPAPVVTQEVEEKILKRIIEPTIKAMAENGTPFIGFLYAGLMIDKNGDSKVVEFNVRLGDPETQPILARMKTDIVEVFLAMLYDRLDTVNIKWDSRVAISVVMTALGYPGIYQKGFVINGIRKAEGTGVIVNHAGTIRVDNGSILSNGGRILCITGMAKDYHKAIEKTYSAVELISMGPSHFRNDIGHRALNR